MAERKRLYDPDITNSGKFQGSLEELQAKLMYGSLDNNQLGGANLQAQSLVNYAKENLGMSKTEEAIKLQKDIQGLTEDRMMMAMKGDMNLAKEFPGIVGIETDNVGEKTKVAMGFQDEKGKQYRLSGGGERLDVDSMILSRNYGGENGKNFEKIADKFEKDQQEQQKTNAPGMKKVANIDDLIKSGQEKAGRDGSMALAGQGIGKENLAMDFGNGSPLGR